MRVVVTGSNGFLGRHLVDTLAARGDEVVALDVVKHGGAAHERVIPTIADLRDEDALVRAFEGAQAIYHAASRVQTRKTDADEVFAVNVGGSRNVISAARKTKTPKVVYVSSASVVYGGADIERGDETLPYPAHFHAPYAEAKARAEREILDANGDDLHTCAIRPHIVFGPGDTRFFPAVLSRAKSGRLKAYVGDPHKKSDFTYVTNLVDGLLLAEAALGPGKPANGKAYFVTNGEPVAFWEFVGKLLDGCGLARPRFRVPFPIAFSTAAIRETVDKLRGIPTSEESLTRFTIRYLTTHHYFSHDRATADLGYRPKVSIDEGIRITVDHLRKSGGL